MKYRYVLKNKHTGVIHFKWYYLTQIEDYSLAGLFDIENYEILSRDRFTGLKDKNGVEIYEGDKVLANGSQTNLKHDMSSARKYVSPTIKDVFETSKIRSQYIVMWDDKFSEFTFKSIFTSCISPDITERNLEVVGNIHNKD